MTDRDYCALEELLDELRVEAEELAYHHNRQLPKVCPNCDTDPHVSGLPCHSCEYVYPMPWAIVRSNEWGYVVRAIGRNRTIIRQFSLRKQL